MISHSHTKYAKQGCFIFVYLSELHFDSAMNNSVVQFKCLLNINKHTNKTYRNCHFYLYENISQYLLTRNFLCVFMPSLAFFTLPHKYITYTKTQHNITRQCHIFLVEMLCNCVTASSKISAVGADTSPNLRHGSCSVTSACFANSFYITLAHELGTHVCMHINVPNILNNTGLLLSHLLILYKTNKT